MDNKYDVFISYSRHDTNVVNEFVERLEREGFSVWIDRDGIESGDAFKKIILQAIKNSAVVLFFSSQYSNQSSWTAKEIGVAVKYKKPVIPILLDGSNFNEEVEFDLINLDFIDYQDVTVRGIMMDRLVKSLKTKIANPIGLKKAEEARLKAEAAERERLEQERRKKEEAERKALNEIPLVENRHGESDPFPAPKDKPNKKNRRKILWLLPISIIFGIGLFLLLNNNERSEEMKSEVVDLFFAIDVSNSMNAQDVLPSRIERSKQVVNGLVNEMHGNQIGLIVFDEKAFVQLPLTGDSSRIYSSLSNINTNFETLWGKSISEAINLAVNSFSDDEHRKVVIIISDGEEHETDAAFKAAKEAAKEGVRIYTIGIGLREGCPIPFYNQHGDQVGYCKDSIGATVVTRLNEQLLQEIAMIGNGLYVYVNNGDQELGKILDELTNHRKTSDLPIVENDDQTVTTTQFKTEFWTLIHNRETILDSYVNLFQKYKNKVDAEEYEYLYLTILKDYASFCDWANQLKQITPSELKSINTIEELKRKIE